MGKVETIEKMVKLCFHRSNLDWETPKNLFSRPFFVYPHWGIGKRERKRRWHSFLKAAVSRGFQRPFCRALWFQKERAGRGQVCGSDGTGCPRVRGESHGDEEDGAHDAEEEGGEFVVLHFV